MRTVSGSPPFGRDSAFSGWLDLFRGLAAFAVLYGHARPLFFMSLAKGESISLPSRFLYFLSGFGHSAVMVFFVLSGFLVGGTVIRATREGRWTWRSYVIQRWTRLYIVLIPALVLTLGWDYAESVQSGELSPNSDTAVANIQSSTIREHTSPAIFAGNAVFLQTILVPSLGSNTPLWSLTNEFWYYLVFPLLWLGLAHSGWGWIARAGSLGAAVGILILLGVSIAFYFAIWLFGCGVWLLPESQVLRRPWPRRAVVSLLAVAVLVALYAARTGRFGSVVIGDFAVGVAFSGLLYCLKHNRRSAAFPAFRKASAGLADFSYTLYLVHLPPLIFLRSCLTYQTSWSPTFHSWAKLALILALVVAYSYLVSLVTERQTERVRKWLERSPKMEPQQRTGPGSTIGELSPLQGVPVPAGSLSSQSPVCG